MASPFGTNQSQITLYNNPDKLGGLILAPLYKLSPGYSIEESGVYYQSDPDGKKPPLRLSSKIEVIAHTADEHDQNHGLLTSWTSKTGVLHRWAVPCSLLAGGGLEIQKRLLDGGAEISITRKGNEKFLEYLQTTTPLRRMTCINRIGWYHNNFILYDQVFPANNEIIFQTNSYDTRHPFKTKGTLEEWQKNVACYALGNNRLIFSLCTAFMGPLLKLMKVESTIFHFVGQSSTGKSTTLIIGVSAWGGYGDDDFGIKQWRSTDNAQEAILASYNDCFLAFDELGQADGRTVGDTVYMIANQKGKSRLNSSASLKLLYEWRVVVLSSGEITLEEKMGEAGKKYKAGLGARFINIPAVANDSQHGIFENLHHFSSGHEMAEYFKKACTINYGIASRHYLDQLVALVNQNLEELIQKIRDLQDQFMDRAITQKNVSGQIQRVARKFSLAAAAGELGIDLGVLPFPSGTAFDACLKCFADWLEDRGTVGDSDLENGVNKLRLLLDSFGSFNFSTIDSDGKVISPATKERYGYRKLVNGVYEYYIFPGHFKKLCEEWGINKSNLDHELTRRKHLAKDHYGNNPLESFEGHRRRMYHVLPSIFNEGN